MVYKARVNKKEFMQPTHFIVHLVVNNESEIIAYIKGVFSLFISAYHIWLITRMNGYKAFGRFFVLIFFIA